LLFGLGLRCGEAARLTRADVDLDRQLLVICDTKFGKSRLVPFGPSMAARLTAYIQLRERESRKLTVEAPIFSFTSGRPIHPAVISQIFHKLVSSLGLAVPSGVRPPCAHHLRQNAEFRKMPSDCRLGLDFSGLAIRACGIVRSVLPAPLEAGRRGIEHKCVFRIREDDSTAARGFERSSATELLQVGVDSSVIALRLWHKSSQPLKLICTFISLLGRPRSPK
jgi:hypothetical protein